jgi:hypothetical protein
MKPSWVFVAHIKLICPHFATEGGSTQEAYMEPLLHIQFFIK